MLASIEKSLKFLMWVQAVAFTHIYLHASINGGITRQGGYQGLSGGAKRQ